MGEKAENTFAQQKAAFWAALSRYAVSELGDGARSPPAAAQCASALCSYYGTRIQSLQTQDAAQDAAAAARVWKCRSCGAILLPGVTAHNLKLKRRKRTTSTVAERQEQLTALCGSCTRRVEYTAQPRRAVPLTPSSSSSSSSSSAAASRMSVARPNQTHRPSGAAAAASMPPPGIKKNSALAALLSQL